MAAGFDPAVFQQTLSQPQHPIVAINAGLGSTTVIEHLALTRLALRNHKVKTLIYGFFDQQLSSDIIQRAADIIGNHAILYYQEPELTLQYAPFDFFDRLNFQVYRHSSLLSERSSIWEKVERLRRSIGSLGMPKEETNRFGRKQDFSLLEAGDPEAFRKSCETVIRTGEFLSPPVQALLQQAKDHHTRVIVVEMPMHPVHVSRFYNLPIWKTFRDKTRRAVEESGAGFIDASTWVPESDLFADHLHLAPAGATRFSKLIASTNGLVSSQ